LAAFLCIKITSSPNDVTLHTLKATFAIALSILLLASSLPLRVSWHSCAGRVVDWSLQGKAEACGHADEMEEAACPMHAEMASVKKNCCADHSLFFEGEPPVKTHDRQVTAPVAIPMPLPLLLATRIVAVPSVNQWNSIAHWHPPPLSGRDIVVREGTFLI
jgi:hypothetical protein